MRTNSRGSVVCEESTEGINELARDAHAASGGNIERGEQSETTLAWRISLSSSIFLRRLSRLLRLKKLVPIHPHHVRRVAQLRIRKTEIYAGSISHPSAIHKTDAGSNSPTKGHITPPVYLSRANDPESATSSPTTPAIELSTSSPEESGSTLIADPDATPKPLNSPPSAHEELALEESETDVPAIHLRSENNVSSPLLCPFSSNRAMCIARLSLPSSTFSKGCSFGVSTIRDICAIWFLCLVC